MAKTFDPPLSNAVTHILLALSGGALHGYGIMQEIRRLSGDKYRLGTGTLYANLSPLLGEGLIEAISEGTEASRREYRLTANGASLLLEETARLDAVVRNARARLISPTEGVAQ